MELRHLRYFVVLAEELHFGRAARRLSITQPPLSFNLRSLEDELRVQLFERNSKQVTLTAAGSAFLSRARDILAHAESARQLARAVANGRLGRLEVAYAGSLVYLGMIERIQAFGRTNPDVEVLVKGQPSREQCDSLRSGSIDIGFVSSLTEAQGLEHRTLASEDFALCMPSLHPLATRKRLSLHALREASFVMYSSEETGGYRAYVISMCAAAGFVPKIAAMAAHTLGIIALVSQGLGIAVVPRSFSRAGIAGTRFIPLDDESASPFACHMVWNPNRGSAILQRFVDSMQVERHPALEAAPAWVQPHPGG